MPRKLQPKIPPPPDFGISFANGGPGIPKHAYHGPKDRLQDFDTWDAATCIRRFCRYAKAGNVRGLERIKPNVARLGCLRECVQAVIRQKPTEATGIALLQFWLGYGLSSIGIGANLKGNLPLYAHALRRHLKPYHGPPMTLYRGQQMDRHEAGVYGIAWTSQLETAEMFAGYVVAHGGPPAVILRIEATPAMIVVGRERYAEYLSPDESEYIIDPRLISSPPDLVRELLPEKF